MALLHHLGITVDDLARGVAQFDPVLQQLGYTRHDAEQCTAWVCGDESEILLYPARQAGTAPHEHGRVGWQHLAFRLDSRTDVERMHTVALGAGWTAVREPTEYPRYTEGYYASFVESTDGIRIEFMHNPTPFDPTA